jgi:hypothetical protein
MSEKTRYSDEELEEFKMIINGKLDQARKDFDLLKSAITQSESNDTQDTSPTFKVLEEGLPPFRRRKPAGWRSGSRNSSSTCRLP